MSTVCSDSDFSGNTELHIYDVEAELVSEICSLLEVHDQMNMRRVCRWWRMSLSEKFLSRIVDIDNCRMLHQSDKFLEHMSNIHVQKNTKILILRHINFDWKAIEFGIIARVIQQKHADLIQLNLKDCTVEREHGSAAFHWTEHSKRCKMPDLVRVTKKLVLENYTMRDCLISALLFFDSAMPWSIDHYHRRHRFDLLPIVLPRHEFDCTKPVQQLYYSFIMALNSNCPEVCPEIRNKVKLLCNSWTHCKAKVAFQWRDLNNVIKCLDQGVADHAFADLDVDVSALRQLDPGTLNKLTIHALHHMYF